MPLKWPNLCNLCPSTYSTSSFIRNQKHRAWWPFTKQLGSPATTQPSPSKHGDEDSPKPHPPTKHWKLGETEWWHFTLLHIAKKDGAGKNVGIGMSENGLKQLVIEHPHYSYLDA